MSSSSRCPISAETVSRDHEEILGLYADLGYPRELVTAWSLPVPDALNLIPRIAEREPRKLLEIGTFVGVTTLLLARATGPDCEIHTVDPNFPLEIDFDAMSVPTSGRDLAIRSQELARQAAERLELGSRIHFHEGGFASGDTYATYLSRPSERVPVVGEEIGKTHGPFDLVFVDGLHFEDAVLADLRMATRFLTPDGVIALHDVIGMWGSNVRRALHRFLDEEPGFVLDHDPYDELYHSIAWLRRVPEEARAAAPEAPFDGEVARALAAHVVRCLAPSSVIQIGGDPAFAARLRDLDVPRVDHSTGAASGAASGEPHDVCLSFEPRLEDLDAHLASAREMILILTPPGERGVTGGTERPVRTWSRALLERGYVLEDTFRPAIESLGFAFLPAPVEDQVTSRHLGIYSVRPIGAEEPAHLREALTSRDARIEDLSLQLLAQRRAIRYLFHQWNATQKAHDGLVSQVHELQRRLEE